MNIQAAQPMRLSKVTQEDDFAFHLKQFKQNYADSLKLSYGLDPAIAQEKGDLEIDELLDRGVKTPDHLFYEIVDAASSDRAGGIWVAKELKYGAEQAFLYYIYVLEPFRRRGHASAALGQLSDIIKTEWGVGALSLNVFQMNAGAIKMYQKCGFETVKSTMTLTSK